MGFGRNSEEKQNDTAIKSNTTATTNIASDAANRGNNAFKFFKQSALPVKDFFSSILTGDRSKITDLLGPELSTIKDTYAGEREANTELTPRSGMRSSGYSDSADKESAAIGDTLLKARPAAAEGLFNLANLFNSSSASQTGLAESGYNAASGNLFNLNKEQSDVRANQAQFWGSLGQGAGSIIGGLLLKPK